MRGKKVREEYQNVVADVGELLLDHERRGSVKESERRRREYQNVVADVGELLLDNERM